MKDRSFRDNYKYVFDAEGQYGGNQNDPAADPLKYAHVVRKYHPGFPDEQIKAKLNLLKTEGCGYVALINTLFLRFYGEEEKFRELFGYPMFTPGGKLNFNELIVDFYCATDNHNKWLWFDSINPYEDSTYKNGYGTNVESREWRFESYMKKHGISVDVEHVLVIPQTVEDVLKQHPLIVAVRPEKLYDKDGKLVESSDNGHAMTVTGIADNGLIRVSSWGKEYYIRHGEYSEHENYQVVIYKN